ncbi:DUF6456 domain-containing protein [Sediminimonas qiaohouensis]|uniref:DUF6456 domain-containing protein n=1 Tax=Sediminimonas qiaohouensis TaxID=552061 RepID=UPI000685B9FD|nr:DUF6456 domain-containing protein [Sediminimonas qiaohouensis]
MPRAPISTRPAEAHVPCWVPVEARRYLAHTEQGQPIRELARKAGCHASTVLRQIRNIESRRDDLLVDEALRCLGGGKSVFMRGGTKRFSSEERQEMQHVIAPEISLNEDNLKRDAAPVLSQLCAPATVLAVARDMDKAVVVRDTPQGETKRMAVVDRPVAQAMALKGWIDCPAPGRVSRYHITAAGREACRHALAEVENRACRGFEEAQALFSPAPGHSERPAHDDVAPGRVRYGAVESPVVALARRRDKDGKPFLGSGLVNAAERLREDFELAEMADPRGGGWERLAITPDAPTVGARGGISPARTRVAAALRDLGPGLGDIALRCCCYLEGLETAEKRLGWSARSTKVVLRIALQRLKSHYDSLGPAGGG